MRTRLIVLGIAVAAHATISQLLYGGFPVDVPAPIAQVQGGAQSMYYGGDIAELLLAAALVAPWCPARHQQQDNHAATGRSPRRGMKRSLLPGPAAGRPVMAARLPP